MRSQPTVAVGLSLILSVMAVRAQTGRRRLVLCSHSGSRFGSDSSPTTVTVDPDSHGQNCYRDARIPFSSSSRRAHHVET
jgi:hypothetical protein